MLDYEIQAHIRILSDSGTRSFKITEDNSLILLAELAKELPVNSTDEYEAIKKMINCVENPE